MLFTYSENDAQNFIGIKLGGIQQRKKKLIVVITPGVMIGPMSKDEYFILITESH